MSHRIGFDPSLPLVSATEFLAGDAQIKVGDSVDWKKQGITEAIVFDWWRAGMIYHPEAAAPAEAIAASDTKVHADAEEHKIEFEDEEEEHVDEKTGAKTRRKKSSTSTKAKR